MKTTKRFDQAYNALVKAYFNGTLASGSCIACAVGNMICDATGFEIDPKKMDDREYQDENIIMWYDSMMYNDNGLKIQKEVEELTGYDNSEIHKIEYAFEENTKIFCKLYYSNTEQEILEDQYNGLAAVVDVLLELDGLTDNGHKAKFRTHPKLETV